MSWRSIMADHTPCPHCGKSITPVEKWVVIWEKGALRTNLAPWVVAGVIGLLMVMLGLIILVLYRLSSAALAGAAVAILGCFLLVSLALRYLRAVRRKQRRQVCPLCKHHWIGQGSKDSATAGLESYFTDVEDLRGEFEEL